MTINVVSAHMASFVSSSGPIAKTDSKIRSFARLPAGWHYGTGIPARSDVVRVAREYLWHLLMLGFPETDAFPGVGGEIMVTAYRGDHRVQVTVELDRTFVVTHEFGDDERYHEDDLSGLRACAAINAIAEEIEQEECITLSSFTPSTTITALVSSQTWLSRPLVTGQALPSSRSNVELMQAGLSALTSRDSITALGANRLSFGDLTTQTLIAYAT